jgi:hypothetical protein
MAHEQIIFEMDIPQADVSPLEPGVKILFSRALAAVCGCLRISARAGRSQAMYTFLEVVQLVLEFTIFHP